jgi:hypothetical protein
MNEDSAYKKEYGTFEELVSDLEARSKSKNPKIAKEAKEILKKIDDQMQSEIDDYVDNEYFREKEGAENE